MPLTRSLGRKSSLGAPARAQRRRGTPKRGADAARAGTQPPWTNFVVFLARWSESVQFVHPRGEQRRAQTVPRPARPAHVGRKVSLGVTARARTATAWHPLDAARAASAFGVQRATKAVVVRGTREGDGKAFCRFPGAGCRPREAPPCLPPGGAKETKCSAAGGHP